MSFLAATFAENGLTPHGFCLLWQPGLIWLHVVSDAVTGASYYAIPVALAYSHLEASRHRFRSGVLDVCSVHTGVRHDPFFDVWTLWHPDYAIQGIIKAITAAISITTAAMLWLIMPQLLQLQSRADLRHANEQLSL
jgi:hypothetical protein